MACGRDRELWLNKALAWSNTGSPRFTDFPSNLIGREYETNALSILRKSDPARALDPCHRPEGSWALGMRMDIAVKNWLKRYRKQYSGSFFDSFLLSLFYYLFIKQISEKDYMILLSN